MESIIQSIAIMLAATLAGLVAARVAIARSERACERRLWR